MKIEKEVEWNPLKSLRSREERNFLPLQVTQPTIYTWNKNAHKDESGL